MAIGLMTMLLIGHYLSKPYPVAPCHGLTHTVRNKMTNPYAHVKFIIQCETYLSKRYPFRVCTIGGDVLGYFRHQNDAIAFCNSI